MANNFIFVEFANLDGLKKNEIYNILDIIYNMYIYINHYITYIKVA
jgi:hypothetical protein